MKYLIDEKELKEFNKRPWTMDTTFEQDLNLFLKSKQPVEEIASGEVKINNVYGKRVEIYHPNGSFNYLHESMEKYEGKQIKIFIQEVQK